MYTTSPYEAEFAQKVRALAPFSRSVLDIGCADGTLLAMLPHGEKYGIDLSPAPPYTKGDFLSAPTPCTDLAVSYSTLHLIGSADEVFRRVAAVLSPGGVLIATVPSNCLFNRALGAVRGAFRVMRCRPLERLLLWLGGLLLSMPKEMLEQRLEYMFTPPRFYYGSRDVREALARAGLKERRADPDHHSNILQMRHVLIVLER